MEIVLGQIKLKLVLILHNLGIFSVKEFISNTDLTTWPLCDLWIICFCYGAIHVSASMSAED